MLFPKEQQCIQNELEAYREKGLKPFISSSFQSHSLPLLHLISQYEPDCPVYFLETGFHFAETLEFVAFVSKEFGLNLKFLRSPIPKSNQRNKAGAFYYTSEPDTCCYLNKVLPMDTVLASHDIWISGVRKDQNVNRASFEREMPGAQNTLRYHPILDWTSAMISEYRSHYKLPEHPLEAQGIQSVGCAPCTQKPGQFSFGESRDGRWSGMKKTECGLHTELVKS